MSDLTDQGGAGRGHPTCTEGIENRIKPFSAFLTQKIVEKYLNYYNFLIDTFDQLFGQTNRAKPINIKIK